MTRLAQHFLKNKAALKKIAAALELRPEETVIEIGPGHGELTRKLADFSIKLIVIEKDSRLAARLKSRNLNAIALRLRDFIVYEADILKILPQLSRRLKTTSYKLVGNIPYYITGRLLRILSELENKPRLAVFTLQKEVAQRIVAQPPRMNRLAAIVQFWAEPKILFHIPPRDFTPPPEVQSSVIQLKVRGKKLMAKEEDYYKLVKILFAHPRKTIANNLKPLILNPAALNPLGLTGQERPQELDLDTLIKISDIIEK